MHKKILVGLDGSTHGLAATREAVELAKLHDRLGRKQGIAQLRLERRGAAHTGALGGRDRHRFLDTGSLGARWPAGCAPWMRDDASSRVPPHTADG